jgi:hypothetical protein
MSVQGLFVVVALASGALALWIDVRFDSGPRAISWCFINTGGSLIVLRFMPAVLTAVVDGSDSPSRKVLAVMLVLLPALIYAWLSTIWLLKLVQRHAHLRS